MPEEPSEAGKSARRNPSSATIDMDQILDLLRLDNERRSSEIALMAERLALTLAKQLGGGQGSGDLLDVGRIRDYELTRRKLAGPFDDEAVPLGAGAIVSVTPSTLHVGRECRVLLRGAGQAAEVAFASDGGTLTVRVSDEGRHAGKGTAASAYQLVVVNVPPGAITGPISVVTETGTLTSTFDVPVAAETAGYDLGPDVFMAVLSRRGER
jgi:hypothetical protein